jgi:hypothetical protein
MVCASERETSWVNFQGKRPEEEGQIEREKRQMATKAMVILELDHMHTEICQSIYVQVAINVYHTHAWILYLPLLTKPHRNFKS